MIKKKEIAENAFGKRERSTVKVKKRFGTQLKLGRPRKSGDKGAKLKRKEWEITGRKRKGFFIGGQRIKSTRGHSKKGNYYLKTEIGP